MNVNIKCFPNKIYDPLKDAMFTTSYNNYFSFLRLIGNTVYQQMDQQKGLQLGLALNMHDQ